MNKMGRYKSYGKGWHFESYRHSLAAKGILSRIQKIKAEAATPVFGYTVAPEIRKMKESDAKALVVAGTLAETPKSAEEKMALRELELTLKPRERRGIRVMKLITQKISPPHTDEDFDHYDERVKGTISEFMPLNAKVDVRLPGRGISATGVTTAMESPSAEEYIDYLLERRYPKNLRLRFGFYDSSTKSFTSEYKGAVSKFETIGGEKLSKKQEQEFEEALEPIEEKIRKAKLEKEVTEKPIEVIEIKPEDVAGVKLSRPATHIDSMRQQK